MKPLFFSFFLAAITLVLPACQSLPSAAKESDASVVFALGSREGFSSPLLEGLKPACPALNFTEEDFALTGAHQKILSGLAADWSVDKPRYLIAGYAPPGLPEDFARSLSERRAQAVRQFLIESGIEAAKLQTVGFGFDSSPNSPTSSVVVIYRQ
jgi:outer membrane protein OmpA-like peptidoglycan-associated protein